MSRLPFEVFLALRYLRPKRTFVSVITLISVLGVTLGVAVLIIVISVMSGFDRQLRERILGFSTHLKVFQSESTMTNYAFVARQVAMNPHVRGVSPFVLGQVLLKTQPQHGKPSVIAPWVRGADPVTEGTVSVLTNSIRAGRFDLNGHGLLTGTEFARAMHLEVGDHVAIYSPNDFERMERSLGKTNQDSQELVMARDYQVTGIFRVGYYEYDATVVVTSLENAQELYGLANEDSVHGLLVMLDDPYQADEVREEIQRALGPAYRISTWMDENSILLGQLVVEKNVMFYILIFIMVVAAFGITSSQITFVVQKTREIGMLKALGATTPQVMGLFLSQTVAVGLFGVLGGYGLGMLALAYRNEFLDFMDRTFHKQLFPPELYGFDQLPALIVGRDIAVVCIVSFIICVVAGVFPAWNAGRLKPVEALRHE